jgi:hypothetical protein
MLAAYARVPSRRRGRIQLIQRPLGRVVLNVNAKAGEVGLIPDNVFVVIALPESSGKWRPTQLAHAHNVFVRRD